MLCDLHTHSVFSDGSCTPAKIIDLAIEAGLSAIALTDHNTVDGLPDFLAAARSKAISAVAGAEFSVDHNGRELHLLGLFIPPKQFGRVAALMANVNRLKEESNVALIESLGRAGYPLNYAAIKSATPKGQVNRAQIAAAMVEQGYIGSVAEGFDTLLSPAAGHYKEPPRLDAREMIDFIGSIGAVSVLAHPLLNLEESELTAFLETARGLDGMECYYATYSEKTTERSIEIAERFGLIKSGGSDFHGTTKPDIQVGIGRGDLAVPHACCLELKKRAEKISV